MIRGGLKLQGINYKIEDTAIDLDILYTGGKFHTSKYIQNRLKKRQTKPQSPSKKIQQSQIPIHGKRLPSSRMETRSRRIEPQTPQE